ncbi:N-acetylmuramic acid 6-phosphate etherase [Myroides sp. DF42-4-2]|uniref:N-acetylmuramic acid 6-phosphate etherase n=1 Tax=unclassified Myroides TaxID=2642485 RepID=UPI0015F78DA5|nr:N-acetylmuramic acid 6-phosphate etherase [Myroides sp. DF42-4-2]MBB1149372.1 N-acetylmuramic acid 6-phosphate etherase [Myroides sp. NP-2]MDM1406725.1 N-acetylmuramic acid 6-phosphate etherase [Myroides sp. DF42-4-2]
MDFIRITEQPSSYDDLEKMSVQEILTNINTEDQSVPLAVEKAIPQIEAVVERIVEQLQKGGRLFYMGAGTSGRLGILDASECPPTYGVSPDLVIGLIAGGDQAIRKAVENAEDNANQGWLDLQAHQIQPNDFVIGIAASGTTPYVIHALQACQTHQIPTACITCNPNSPVSQVALLPIEVVVGPEFVTGSSRMKAGTAQKLVLNMISTTVMIQLGRVKGNRMVDMQMTNAKLVQRGIKMLQQELQVSEEKASQLLHQYKSVRAALENYKL